MTGRVVMHYMVFVATRDTVEMTHRMSDAGADAVLVITPCFYKNAMNNDALSKHFNTVCWLSNASVPHYSSTTHQ